MTETLKILNLVVLHVRCQCLPMSMIQAMAEFVRKGTDTWFLSYKYAHLTYTLTEIWDGAN